MPAPIGLMPRRPVPNIRATLTDGTAWSLHDEAPENFTLLVVYRGLHCPICKTYLGTLQALLPQFAERGVAPIAVSTDPEDRGRQAQADWDLPHLRMGHGLSLADARSLGLYISASRGVTSAGIEELSHFAEPGLFLIRNDHTLFAGMVQTVPFARPPFEQLLSAIDFVLAKDYPPRGDVLDVPDLAAE